MLAVISKKKKTSLKNVVGAGKRPIINLLANRRGDREQRHPIASKPVANARANYNF